MKCSSVIKSSSIHLNSCSTEWKDSRSMHFSAILPPRSCMCAAQTISLVLLQEKGPGGDGCSPADTGRVEGRGGSNRITPPINPRELPFRDAIHPSTRLHHACQSVAMRPRRTKHRDKTASAYHPIRRCASRIGSQSGNRLQTIWVYITLIWWRHVYATNMCAGLPST